MTTYERVASAPLFALALGLASCAEGFPIRALGEGQTQSGIVATDGGAMDGKPSEPVAIEAGPARAEMGEPCNRGETQDCICPETGTAGRRVCFYDEASPSDGFFEPGCGQCAMPTCADGARNGTESDIDCGGSECAPCADGRACATPSDCESGLCGGTTCGGSGPEAGDAAGGGGLGGAGGGGMGGLSGGGGLGGAGGGGVGGLSGGSGIGAGAGMCEGFVTSMGTGDACAECMCSPSACLNAVLAVVGDTLAEAVVSCATQTCVNECCVCDRPCDLLGLAYGNGPCVAEVERAVGVEPGGGALINGLAVDDDCKNNRGSSCNKALEMGDCELRNCRSECGTVACN